MDFIRFAKSILKTSPPPMDHNCDLLQHSALRLDPGFSELPNVDALVVWDAVLCEFTSVLVIGREGDSAPVILREEKVTDKESVFLTIERAYRKTWDILRKQANPPDSGPMFDRF